MSKTTLPTVYLSSRFSQLWKNGDPFAAVEKLQGQIFRELEARRTLRVVLQGKAYFVKIHRGIGWREILKNLLYLRLPVLGAGSEYLAVRRLQNLGVGTMEVAAFAKRGRNPARQHSFIITEAIEPSISLQDFCCPWPQRPPEPRLKRNLINKVADISRRLHNNGVNHRDYYLCHFLLRTGEGEIDPAHLPLVVIDLHRVQLRSTVPSRWRVKDLAGLYYSAMKIGLTQRDYLRFIRAYRQRPLSDIFPAESRFWDRVRSKAQHLFAKDRRKGIV